MEEGSLEKRSSDDTSILPSGSSIYRVAHMDSVDLFLSDREHEIMDQRVLDECYGQKIPAGDLQEKDAFILLSVIIGSAPELQDRLDQFYVNAIQAAERLHGNDRLLEELKDAWMKKSFKKGPELISSVHTPLRYPIPRTASTYVKFGAQELAWKIQYRNGVARNFLQIINKRFATLDDTERYAHHATVIQSSGTGKSRMLHEVCNMVFGVVFNFNSGRRGRGTVHPEPDNEVRAYFMETYGGPGAASARVHAFFISLFDCLCATDVTDPSELRWFLGYGNPERASERVKFFDQILHRARGMSLKKSTSAEWDPYLPQFTTKDSDELRSISKAAKEFSERFLNKVVTSSQVQFIVGLDDADESTVDVDQTSGSWNIFAEIRGALSVLREFPIYSVFMSTMVPVYQSHHWAESGSYHIQPGLLRLRMPYTLLGFDQLAKPLRSGCTLDDVTDIDYMTGLGRPLFKAMYNSGNTSIVAFAREKLLNGEKFYEPRSQITSLAARLPLTFNAMTELGRTTELEEIEFHMRICLAAFPDARVVTLAPSEPLLIEAAARCMGSREDEHHGYSAYILAESISMGRLSKGDRGELAITLLMLLAHDRAAWDLPNDYSLRPVMAYHRPICVISFLQKLFAETNHATLFDAGGTSQGKTLQETFSESWMNFTHFIKTTDCEIVNPEYLVHLMARGAALFIADSQLGVDIILPYCFKGKTLIKGNIAGILVQVRNIDHLMKRSKSIFAEMEPRSIGMFPKNFKDHPPFIKLFFNVGSPTSRFDVMKRSQTHHVASEPGNLAPQPPKFEFFINGLSHTIFSHISSNQETNWKTVASIRSVADMYGRGERDDALPAVRKMMPCVSVDNDH